jgi:hypothetical protein
MENSQLSEGYFMVMQNRWKKFSVVFGTLWRTIAVSLGNCSMVSGW